MLLKEEIEVKGNIIFLFFYGNLLIFGPLSTYVGSMVGIYLFIGIYQLSFILKELYLSTGEEW